MGPSSRLCRTLAAAACAGRLLRRRRHARLFGTAAASSWLDAPTPAQRTGKQQRHWFASVDELFVDARVQRILADLNTRSFDARVFYERHGGVLQQLRRSKHHLMSDEELEAMREQMRETAVSYLQIPPIMECRQQSDEPISVDADLAGLDTADFVFTDISFGTTDRERSMVKRSGADGTLRPVVGEQRDRVNRLYFAYADEFNEEAPFVPVDLPKMLFDPYLERSLARGAHLHVLNTACQMLEPDSEHFIRVSVRVYRDVDSNRKHANLWSSRFWAALCFYVTLNDCNWRVMQFLADKALLADCADLCRLSAVVRPQSRAAKAVHGDDDRAVVENFVAHSDRLDGSLELAIERMLKDDGRVESDADHRRAETRAS